MITRTKVGPAIWINLEQPTREEVIPLVNELGLPPIVVEEFLAKSIRSKADVYQTCIYGVFHFPTRTEKNGAAGEYELDVTITENILITVHYEPIPVIQEFAKVLDTQILLGRAKKHINPAVLFATLMGLLYRTTGTTLERLKNKIENVEENIFSHHEEDMVMELSYITRTMLDYERALHFHRPLLETMTAALPQFIDATKASYLSHLISEYEKIETMLLSYRNTITALRETNMALLTTKTNKLMKTLTLIAFLTLPITLTAVLLTIPHEASPFPWEENSFWILLGILVGIGLAIFGWFKGKHWL